MRANDVIDYGASPRATLAIANLARAKALLADRDFAVPDEEELGLSSGLLASAANASDGSMPCRRSTLIPRLRAPARDDPAVRYLFIAIPLICSSYSPGLTRVITETYHSREK